MVGFDIADKLFGRYARDDSVASADVGPAFETALPDDGGCALVLEGGGYRGVFTAGVLDVLLEKGVTGFSSVWGTSAGALNAVTFRARQIGRYIRVVLAFRDDSRMMSFVSLAKTGSIAGNDFLYREVQERLDPFDNDTYNAGTTPVWACATDVTFGTPAYLPVRSLPDDIEKIVASASLPCLSEIVDVDGRLCLDGGTADSVPVEVALDLTGFDRPDGAGLPATHALVVLTQPRDYRKDPGVPLMSLARRQYADYPYYLEALEARPGRYNEQRERIFELESEGRVTVIAPTEPLGIPMTGGSGEVLLSAYLEGRRQGAGCLEGIRELLSSR